VERLEDVEQLDRVRRQLEALVSIRLRRPLSGTERDRWRSLVNVERQLLEATASPVPGKLPFGRCE